MKKSKKLSPILKSGGLLLAGILVGWLIFGGSESSSPEENMTQHVEEAHTDEQGEVIYTCSMHPSVRQNEPGDCPICGMELVPVSEVDSQSQEDQHPQALQMTKTAMQLANVQTTRVIQQAATQTIRMPGKVTVDERATSVIPAHFPGRIEELDLNFTGAYVEKGDKLASVYSPELITAQRELLEAYKNRDSNPRLYQSARQKFINWEISPEVINKILERGEPQQSFDVYSPRSGYVTQRHVAVGDHIQFGKAIFEIADLSSVWIKFDAYETDLAGLSVGDRIEFSVKSLPARTFESEVTYIDPLIDESKRTASVRTEIENNNRQLKPNMLVQGTVSSKLNDGQEVLQIPKQAVLWTGKRSLVYVKLPDTSQTRFEAREIKLGSRVGDNYVIEYGLQEGEKVVIRGNFMIDSAAQLADKRSMMNTQPGSGGNQSDHNHGELETNKPSISEVKQSQLQISADTSDHQHTKHLAALVNHYLGVKNALTDDEFEEARNHLQDFRQEVIENPEMNNHNEHSKMHQKHHTAMVEAVKQASEAETIEELREVFILISENLLMAIKNQDFDQQELYLQYCPMANSGDGAKWISEDREIRNPLYGKQMHNCGETVESLN